MSVPIHERSPKEKCVPKVWSQPLFFSESKRSRKPKLESESRDMRQPTRTNDEN